MDDVVPTIPPESHDSVVDKLTALSAAIAFSQKQHFEQFEPYVYLEVLATHPAHRGQGYAKALCAVGVDSAQKRSLAVAALTSSRGYIFFSGMAFGDLGCVSLRGSNCSRDDCMLKAMILHPQQKRRRSSVINSFLSYVSLGNSSQ
jgi:GNAT superfamily N-acetyltransferase